MTLGILETVMTEGILSTIITDGIGPTEIIDGMLILPSKLITEGKSPSLGMTIGGIVNSKGTTDGGTIGKSGNVGIFGISGNVVTVVGI